MKIFFKLSWRNVWRNKRRSLVVISSIGLGISAMIFVMSVMNGMNYQMIDNTISTSLGHVSVHKKGLMDNIKPSVSFEPELEIFNRIEKTEGVSGWAPRVKIEGMVRSSESSQGVLILGIDPEREKSVSKLFEYTSQKDGSAYLKNSSSDGVLISESMAIKLDLIIGDRMVVMIQNATGRLTGEAFIVEGIFNSPVESFDKYFIFTGIKRLQAMAGMGSKISEISIRTETRDVAREVKKRVSKYIIHSDIEVLSWHEMAPSMVSAIRLFDTMMYIFFAIVFITVIFSVANTMVMAVMERFHEVGVMKCIGTKPSSIFFMIILEALNLGFAGIVLGLAVGLFLVGILMVTGLDLPMFSESMKIWGTGSVIYPVVLLGNIIASVVIVFFTAIIASVYPAFKAARIKPLKALHYI